MVQENTIPITNGQKEDGIPICPSSSGKRDKPTEMITLGRPCLSTKFFNKQTVPAFDVAEC